MNEKVSFFAELKQRKLVQWTVAYVAAAFALLQGIDIADVALVCGDSSPELLHLANGLVQVSTRRHRVADGVQLPAYVDRDDVGPLLGQADRMRTTLAPRSTGDEGDLPLELPHVSSYPVFRHRLQSADGGWPAQQLQATRQTLAYVACSSFPASRSAVGGDHREVHDCSTSETGREASPQDRAPGKRHGLLWTLGHVNAPGVSDRLSLV